jgi:hypothetical protein
VGLGTAEAKEGEMGLSHGTLLAELILLNLKVVQFVDHPQKIFTHF